MKAEEESMGDCLSHFPEMLLPCQAEGLVLPVQYGVLKEFVHGHLRTEIERPGQDAGQVGLASEGNKLIGFE